MSKVQVFKKRSGATSCKEKRSGRCKKTRARVEVKRCQKNKGSTWDKSQSHNKVTKGEWNQHGKFIVDSAPQRGDKERLLPGGGAKIRGNSRGRQKEDKKITRKWYEKEKNALQLQHQQHPKPRKNRAARNSKLALRQNRQETGICDLYVPKVEETKSHVSQKAGIGRGVSIKGEGETERIKAGIRTLGKREKVTIAGLTKKMGTGRGWRKDPAKDQAKKIPTPPGHPRELTRKKG